ncbi:hypothetical protein CBM2608_B90125 [Cupriavidus taiwanensis]|nr:hypothetical protein CBM2588_B110052 [Cupriavidus taiwanensis]SOY98059.1 hypothetical protein CBM2591_B80274 [Cupriavidus taiwanensis]SOZ31772.1 hypothetical protein CBM2608_B90125 [Cupriavidus taiwanensis]SOZ68381.1 hypothetical protein CBM2617_B120083 [Cupriavidus taiwanensis]SOZ84980.1 hypothetical protein CBM2618_B120083 [Cupriavidus taiwanensis]
MRHAVGRPPNKKPAAIAAAGGSFRKTPEALSWGAPPHP